MKILLLGKNGQVGWELAKSLPTLGEVIALDSQQCDLSCPETIPDIVQAIAPDVIVNAAAYTNVDQAEKEEALATTINGVSVGVLAAEAKKLKALFIHYSTDYVFDGTKSSPYVEKDTPNPVNAYGRSKLAGEKATFESGCQYLVLRTTWVYAARGKNFLKTMLKLAQERAQLRVVNDQHGAPTEARSIAGITAHVLDRALNECRQGNFISGIYHLAASGNTTWHGFASAIIDNARLLSPAGQIKTESVVPITTQEYPLAALRPENSLLNSGLITERFEITMPEWRSTMESCVSEILASP